MKIKLLSVLFLFSFFVSGQINYTFLGTTGTYAANTGATQLIGSNVDETLSAATNIGFTFQYGCVNYTQFKVSSNGWLTFNTTVTGSNATNNLNTSSDRPIIAPLWDDLETSSGGQVNYLLSGTSPNRILTIEWKEMEWNWAANTSIISFQVKLYETSNRIDFHYLRIGNNSNNPNNPSASIGLSGVTSGDYYSLDGTGNGPNASKTLETSNLSSRPSSNQIYRWDPVVCSGTPNGGTAVSNPSTSCTAFNSTLSLSGNSTGCGITYQWQSSASSGGPFTSISGATLSTLAVTNTVTTYYRCVLTCGGSSGNSSVATASVSGSGSCGICNQVNIASLPVTLNNQTNCGEGNNITSSNVSNVCGSSSYYGGEDITYAFTPATNGAITVSVTSGSTWMGIMLYSGCPISGGTCVGNAQSSAGNQTLCATVTAGQTYYLVVDAFPSPTCHPSFNLNISAPGGCTGSYTASTASAAPSNGCSNYNTSLSLTGFSGCGVILQWQSAATSTGPWTNIPGATSSSTTVPVTATTFYRAILSCGTNTAASNTVTANLQTSSACGLCGVTNIASLPFTLNGQTTCGNGDNITSSNVTNICGSSSYYGGDDAIYSFTPAASGAVTVGVTSSGSYMGITLYNGCPNSGGTCSGYAQSSSGNQTLCASVSAGQTYYLIIDSWPLPDCNPYNVSISAPGSCFGSISGANASASPATGCGTVNTTVNLSGFSACGPTFQWQSSSSAAGPFTNIAGATSQNLTAAVTTTTYYRALLTCGTATALSSVAGVTVTPTGSVACSLSTYTAATTTYSFESFAGTTLPTTDDVLFTTIVNFGFPFCFGGSQYWGGYVASNSAFVFDAVPCFPNIQTSTYAAGGVSTGYSISSPAPVNNTSIPRNAILGPWHDIHPGLGGTIRYYTTGTAPNRKFVVSYESIPMFSCGTASPSIYFTGQIKLFETSNAIEIHVGNKGVCPGFNSGRAVLGLHSFDGTIYVPPVNATAHNSPTQWSMTNTAYRFQSPCAVNNGPCAVLPITFKNFYGEHFENVNKLYWSTSEESNVKHFIVERSSDALNFKPIGYVLPKNTPSNYSLSDQDIKQGTIYYYRVTAEENNGQRKSTFIYPLGGNDDLSISEIYPNPATNTFNIGVINKEQTEIVVTIKDMFGRTLNASTHDAAVGVSTISMNSPASNGVYIVEVTNRVTGKTLSTQKLVVTR